MLAHVNGVKLCYDIVGTGPPIVQIHGSIIGRDNFAFLNEHLQGSFSLIQVDLRGFGRSSKPSRGYSIDTWAADLAALISSLDYGNVHIHGTSMGGLIAVSLAARHPLLVRGLVLDCTLARYDAAALLNKRTLRALVAAYGWNGPTWDLIALQSFSRWFLESPGASKAMDLVKRSEITRSSPGAFSEISTALEEADITPLLPLVNAPTLVTAGEFDTLTPLDLGDSGFGARRIANTIPGARLAIIAGSGHIVMYEKPAEVASIVSEFLNEVEKTLVDR